MGKQNSYLLSCDVIPDCCRREPCCLGIDEAGRGPVLGPMVYSVAFCSLSDEEWLKSMAFADSKTLTESQRDDHFDQIKSSRKIGYFAKVLTPQHISNSMLRRVKYNLNQLSHDTAMDLIQTVISSGVNVQQIRVDTVGDPKSYQGKLQIRFPSILDIKVTPKADSLFPIVSAASIVAKVNRDRILRGWEFFEKNYNVLRTIEQPSLLNQTHVDHFDDDENILNDEEDSTEEKIDMNKPQYHNGNKENVSTVANEHRHQFGSGYPGDPVTKQWLRSHLDPIFGFPSLIRFSWSTCDELLKKMACHVRWPNDETDIRDPQQQQLPVYAFLKRKRKDIDQKEDETNETEDSVLGKKIKPEKQDRNGWLLLKDQKSRQSSFHSSIQKGNEPGLTLSTASKIEESWSSKSLRLTYISSL